MEAMSGSAASGIGGAPPQVRGVIRREAEGDSGEEASECVNICALRCRGGGRQSGLSVAARLDLWIARNCDRVLH